jgi:hypothetical protein
VGINKGVIHLSDTAAAIVGVSLGPAMAVFGARVSGAYWDRMYGTREAEGRLYTPILRRVPRPLGRAFFIGMGIFLTCGGIVLIALGRA